MDLGKLVTGQGYNDWKIKINMTELGDTETDISITPADTSASIEDVTQTAGVDIFSWITGKSCNYTFTLKEWQTAVLASILTGWTYSSGDDELYMRDDISTKPEFAISFWGPVNTKHETIVPVGTPEDSGEDGDGSTTAFTFDIANTPIKHTGGVAGVTITCTGQEDITDDGEGNLASDSDGSTGTVNYLTGAVSITYGTAPEIGDIEVYYTYFTKKQLVVRAARCVADSPAPSGSMVFGADKSVGFGLTIKVLKSIGALNNKFISFKMETYTGDA